MVFLVRWLILFVGFTTGVAFGAEDKAATTKKSKTATQLQTATFAGGCFWCMEPPFDKLKGVESTVSGYMGGHKTDPTYKEVSSGRTGHAEVVQVRFDPKQVNYAQLLKVFWRNIDPTVKNRQFCDQGSQYRSAIFYHSTAQKKQAEDSKTMVKKQGIKPIHTQIEKAGPFYKAEDYHQNYYQKNPLKYKYYRYRCGRDERLEEVWGDQGD